MHSKLEMPAESLVRSLMKRLCRAIGVLIDVPDGMGNFFEPVTEHLRGLIGCSGGHELHHGCAKRLCVLGQLFWNNLGGLETRASPP